MAQIPVLTQAQCSGTGGVFNVRVSWQYIQEQTYFVAAVFDPSNQIVVQTIVDGSGGTTVAAMANVPLAASTNYTIRVAQSDASGNLTSSYSQPLTVLQAPLTNIVTVNDLTGVAISVTLPTVGPASGVVASLFSANNTFVIEVSIAGSSGVIAPPQPLDPATGYYVYLTPSANQGLSTGGAQRVDLQMSQPEIAAISYDGANMLVTATTAQPVGSGLSGVLLAGGNPIQHAAGGADSVSFAVATASLDLSKQYSCALRAVTGGNSGPASAAVLAVVAAPRLESAYYVGGHVGARWTVPPLAPAPTGAQLAAIADNAVAGEPIVTLGYLGDIDISGVSVTTSLKAQANSVFGLAKGPPASVDLPFTKPEIISVAATDQGAAVAWSAAAGAPGYRLSLDDSTGKPIAWIDTVDLAGALGGPVNPAAPYTISVQPHGVTAAGVEVFGPRSDPVALLAAPPAAATTAYDGAQVTVTWTTPPQTAGVTGYEAVLLDAETLQPTGNSATVTGAGTTSVAINAVLASGRRVVAAVRSTGDKTSGALGPMIEVITALPAVTAADASAATIDLAWISPASPAVTGYVVTISDDAQTPTISTWRTSELRLSVPNTLSAAQVFVRIQATGASVTGPVAAPTNLFGTTPSFYPQPVGGSDTRPYLIRAASNQPTASEIIFAFPDVFTARPQTLPSAGIFALQDNAASTVLPYKLTIPANSVAWTFDATSRATLATDFLDFLKKMEMPDGATVLIKPGALTMIRQSIALGLPLLFSEQLNFMYGFDPDTQTGGYVDLVPGMRLRVDGEVQQQTPPSNNQTGYVPGGTSAYDIQSYAQGQALDTGFNAFLSVLGRPTVPTPMRQPNAGGGGIIDLYAPPGRQPYYRLLYPTAIRDPKYTGLVDESSLPVLLGAATYNGLVAATDHYVSQGNFTGLSDIYPFYFRGRAILTPEISARLGGRPCWMALGSTVANLLTQQGALPNCVSAAIGGFTMRRSIGGLSSDLASTAISTNAVATNRVRLEYPAATFSPTQPGYFGLPLFCGDDIRLEPDGAA